MQMPENGIKFPLGRTVITANAQTHLSPEDILSFLGRHESGDWGDICDDDRQQNKVALIEGLQLLSVYHTVGGTKFWIITEWDRSVTTILLPEDY